MDEPTQPWTPKSSISKVLEPDSTRDSLPVALQKRYATQHSRCRVSGPCRSRVENVLWAYGLGRAQIAIRGQPRLSLPLLFFLLLSLFKG